VLIAFDRDEAGERGAQKVAERLLACGIDCYRIEFPKGMDANEYACKVTPAAKSLGVLIRKAVWLGQGKSKPITTVASAGDVPTPAAAQARPHLPAPEGAALLSLAADAAADAASPLIEATPAAKEETPTLPAAVVPDPARDVAADVKEHEVVLAFGEGTDARRWRVRGLPKSPVFETLKVNVLAAIGDRFHVDTFDLYHARARASFVTHAAVELQVAEDILKADLGWVLLKLEALQEEQLRQALESRKPAAVEMAEADRESALALLRAPDLLARIVADFDASGLVGEATNKLVGYLAAVSRKLVAPLAVVIQSSSAAGKSSLMDAVLAFMPEEERVKYSAMTGQSLFYMGETNLKHKILAICEEEGASRAAYALKLLQSDGELTIASTGKDPDTGNLITQQYRVEGPVMILLTTTAIEIDEELLNRCLVLSVDEGRSQTEAIHALQRRKRTLEGLLAKQERAHLVRLHQNAQRLLRPLAVVNPWADRLTFLSDKTRTRRDHEKYLTLIDVIALLHQHQREVKTTSHRGQPARRPVPQQRGDDCVGIEHQPHQVLPRLRRSARTARTSSTISCSISGVSSSAGPRSHIARSSSPARRRNCSRRICSSASGVSKPAACASRANSSGKSICTVVMIALAATTCGSPSCAAGGAPALNRPVSRRAPSSQRAAPRRVAHRSTASAPARAPAAAWSADVRSAPRSRQSSGGIRRPHWPIPAA
jgi:hypothetical protein